MAYVTCFIICIIINANWLFKEIIIKKKQKHTMKHIFWDLHNWIHKHFWSLKTHDYEFKLHVKQLKG